MIQRKQSLWLLIVALLAALTFIFPFFTGIRNKVAEGLTDINTPTDVLSGGELYALSNIILMLVTAAVAILALVTIFLYKNRSQQRILCFINLILSFGLITLYFYYKSEKYAGGNIALTSIFTFLIPVFLVLAIRGINSDISLLKSVDRLR